jgi:hypothetical protein
VQEAEVATEASTSASIVLGPHLEDIDGTGEEEAEL